MMTSEFPTCPQCVRKISRVCRTAACIVAPIYLKSIICPP